MDEPAASPPALRQAEKVLRLMALASAGMLLALAHLSSLPWLAHGLTLLLLALVYWGWHPRIRPPASRRGVALPAGELRRGEPLDVAVLDAIAAPMILTDRRGHIVHANAEALQAFPGLRQGHPITFFVRAPALRAALEAVLDRAPEARFDLLERVPVERAYDVLVRRLAGLPKTALPDGASPANGTPFAVIFMTETSAARRLEAMRVDFVANASHELRTPLASILGFVETLQGPAREDAAARHHFLGIMETQARRMARLIDDLLSLSKIEMSAHIPPAGMVDLAGLLAAVADALGGLARDRGVVFRLRLPETPASVPGDRDELLRVFENLIENAIKYGQSGGAVEIGIDTVQDAVLGPAFAITVRDFGPGIAAEHLPRLTERFYRADVSESRVMGGTGLGLAIVKHIVTRHRGRLGITSTPGEGAAFTVTLPAASHK
jgi:two-component system, OmpR family, phosphate regulon sensor histidine kinase PhoR